MFSDKLDNLREKQLYRIIRDREAAQGVRIILEGREFLSFASNDYLGLANHPEVINAAKAAMDEFGFGSGASRLLSGGTVLHKRLEAAVAELKATEAALIFNSGYAANTGTIPAIADEGDLIFSDELNHASIIDGCKLSKARTIVYRHKDTAHLRELLEKEIPAQRKPGSKLIIVTDTVFSMDGDIAPLPELCAICASLKSQLRRKSLQSATPNSVLLYLDDAHGTGVLGKGKGGLAHLNIMPEPWMIQMGTFSKALGSHGAFVAAGRNVIEWIINSARSFIFSTALPAAVIAASLKSLEIVNNMPELTGKLWENQGKMVRALIEAGLKVKSETPIIPLATGSVEDSLKVSYALYDCGIYIPVIRPPTVKESRLRIAVTAGHRDEDIKMLADALKKIL